MYIKLKSAKIPHNVDAKVNSELNEELLGRELIVGDLLGCGGSRNCSQLSYCNSIYSCPAIILGLPSFFYQFSSVPQLGLTGLIQKSRFPRAKLIVF